MKWYVTDMDRTFVKIYNSFKKARDEALSCVGSTKLFEKRIGYAEAQTPVYHMEERCITIYMIREDKLKAYGFSDLIEYKKRMR